VFRWHVIQAAITWNCAQTYLEIGLGDLENFFRITAPRMFGVEPVPLSGPILFKAERRGAQIFPLTSDAFFASNAGLFQNGGIDVAFVDGLHTHEQSIRDVYHCLAHLNPGGVILLHDCNPTTESMALPASSYGEGLAKKPPGSSVEWTGDVWKTLVQLRLCDNSLDVGCLDCDYGVGVIVKRPSGRITSMAPEVIRSWTYSELEANRQDLLGLRPPHQLLDMLPQGMRNAQSPLTL
jgi:hypothetical protein